MNKKGLTPKVCIMMAIGGMVGSSIFTLSGVTYGMAGAGAIITWMIAGAVLLLYSLNIAELATTFPKSGGIYVYPHAVLGKAKNVKDFAGWIASWSWLNVTIFGSAFSAICVSTYLQEFIPAIKDMPAIQLLIPLIWLGFVWWLNAKSINAMGKIHNKLTYLLVFVLGVYVILGLFNGKVSNLKPFIGGTMGTMGVVAGIPIAMLAYGSIIAVASFAGDIHEPKKNIPKIIGTAVIMTVTIYSLILLATFMMAPSADFVANPGVQYYPLAYSLGNAIGGKSFSWIGFIIPLAALLALTTNMSIMILDASRTLMATAESGILPKGLSKLDDTRKTPIRALTVVTIAAAILTLKPDLIWLIINTGSIFSAVTVGIIAVTLMVLRSKQKKGIIDSEGLFKVPGGMTFPVITLVVIIVTLVLLSMADGGATSFLLTGLGYGVGIIIFLASRFLGAKKEIIEEKNM